MDDKDFIEAITRMVTEHGKDVLLGGKVKAYISDYKGQFDTEADTFLKLLNADCAKFINEADNVQERKRQLVERMEDKLGISPRFSMPMLDLLGLLLRGDTSSISKAAEQKKAEEEARLKAEVEAKHRAEVEAKVKAEAEAKRRADAEAKAKADADAEAKRRAEAEAKARAEAEAKRRAQAAQQNQSSSTSSSGKMEVNKTAVVSGAIIGAAALGILPGFGFFRLIIGAFLGLLAGIFINREDKNYGFFYDHSDGLFVFALIAAIICTVIGGLLFWIDRGYGMLLWSVFCLIALIFFKVKSDDFTIRGEGLSNFACLAFVLAGSLFLFFSAPSPNKPEQIVSAADSIQTSTQTVTVIPDALNLRAHASGTSDVVKTLYKGDTLNVTGVSINGWLPVEHNGSGGWVSEQYVSSPQTGGAQGTEQGAAQGTQPAPQDNQPAANASQSNVFAVSPSSWERGMDADFANNTQFHVGTETVNGQRKEVLTVEVNLPGGRGWVGGQVVLERTNVPVLSRIRQASGVRFKIISDGKPWKLMFPTTETEMDWCSYEYEIIATKNRVAEVNVPYSSLRQPAWGRQVSFRKNDITAVVLQRDTEKDFGTSTIKIFDFEIY